MKRKYISLFLILILIITITACKGKSVVSDTSKTIKTGVSVKTQPEQKETFYGEWSIKKQIAYGPVSTYSNDDIKKMVGKKLSYLEQKAVYETNICEKPVYKKSTISQADFEASNKVKFSSLGVTNDSMVQVTVYTDSNYKNSWDGTGGTFYIKDQNTLILSDGGVYFELDRQAN